MQQIFFLVSCIIFSFSNLNAQDTLKYKLDDVVVSSSKIPTLHSDLARSVTVISQKEISAAPVQSVQELLKYYSSVDVRTRGPVGVQSDISIRGGSFEQTLILVDGVKLSDAQTGHHNMNLPVNIDDIEKIEILKGQGSKIYGANALAGVINIITKSGQNKNINAEISGGENNFYNGAVSVSLPANNFSNRFSISKSKSDGYIYNTQFENLIFNFSSKYDFNSFDINFSGGYSDKDFGANNFYFVEQNQWERIKTTFINFGSTIGKEKISVSPKIYFRNNKDFYSYDFRGNIFTNEHETNSYGAEIISIIKSNFGSTALSSEIAKDEIESTNLGNHLRTKGGISLEHNFEAIKNLNINFGGFVYKYDYFGWKFWPGIDIGYKLNQNLKIFTSVGKSFRLPSFTELYYKSATRLGSANLQPEEALTYELGLNFNYGAIRSEVSIFRREGKNIIDWAKQIDSLPWQTLNIVDANTNGIEAGFTILPAFWDFNFLLDRADIFYTYLNTEIDLNNFKSLYVLDHLKHQLKLNLHSQSFYGIRNSWTLRFEERLNAEKYFIADTKVSYTKNIFEIYAEAANLLNENYVEIGGIPMPGRWIFAGIKMKYDY